MKKILKLVSILIFLFIIFLIILITFNPNIRRNVLYYPFAIINLYYEGLVKVAVDKKNFEKVSDIILSHLELSQSIYPVKNKMFGIIFKNVIYSSEKALSQKNFNDLEKVYQKIYEIDKNIYLNLVYLAKAESDNDFEKSLIYLNEAIKLSPVSEQAYREIVKIFSENLSNTNIIKTYCEKYEKSILGGLRDYHYEKFFNSNSSTFGIFPNNNENSIVRNFITETNNDNIYNFYFNEYNEIYKLNIIGNFISGSIIKIKNIILNDNQDNQVQLKNLSIIVNKGYLLNHDDDEIKLLVTENDNNIVTIIFKEPKKNIDRVSINFNIKKLPIASLPNCISINE